jgi:hypothetical protein
MEKLSDEQRRVITKMGSARLGAKLVRIGYSEEVLESMSREDMQHAWAQAVLEG